MDVNVYALLLVLAVVSTVITNSELMCREIGNWFTARAKGLRAGKREFERLGKLRLTPKQARSGKGLQVLSTGNSRMAGL